MSGSDFFRLKFRIESFLSHYGKKSHLSAISRGEFIDIINQCAKLFPEYSNFFKKAIEKSTYISGYSTYYMTLSDVTDIFDRIKNFIKLEETINKQLNVQSVFDTAFDRVKMASDSLHKDDIQSVFNHLNSAIELMLKDKLNIPSTYKNIKTSNIIEILISNKKGPYRYLDEVKNRVTFIDNEVKHHGYSPSKPEAIRALKITEELLKKIKDIEFNLSVEIENKIFREV